MQITLNQREIEQAVEAAVRQQITLAPNQDIRITFTAGRGDNGLTASLEVTTTSMLTAAKPTTTFRTTATRAASPIVQAVVQEPVTETTRMEPAFIQDGAISNISTGDERVDPEVEEEASAPEPEAAPEPTETPPAPAPAVKRNSIFSKVAS